MSTPKLSIIVIGYNMARQLMNTLYSLSARFQQGITETDYEVIIVENDSGNNLCPEKVSELGSNFRYFLRQEEGVSPVAAINQGFSLCHGELIGLIIDGARIVSPGALHYALLAHKLGGNVITAIPGYHLGDHEQHLNQKKHYNEVVEQALLEQINWRKNGYKLFDIATFSGANSRGFLQPMMECNCLFAPLKSFASIGYADPQFQLKGGGSVNLHLYRRLGMLPDSKLVVVPGEGSFHQFHGGVTTSEYQGLEEELRTHKLQLHALWDGQFHSLRRCPELLGKVPPQAERFLQLSANFAEKRRLRLANTNEPLWADDVALNNKSH